jgi:phasin
MNIVLNREATTDKSREAARKTNGQFEALTLDTAFSEVVRELAERSVKQTREVYDWARDPLEAAVDTIARSFDALGRGTAALNRKVIEIAQENVSSGFDLAMSLATARTLAEMVELQATHWRKQLSTLPAQAEEVRALSTKVAADMAAPINAHVARSIEQLAGANIAINAEPDSKSR